MACKLCGRTATEAGPLRLSHIIPRFLLAKSKSNGRSMVYSREENRLLIAQGDPTERLLCERCEQKFSSQHEVFLQEVLFLRRKTRVVFEDQNLLILSESNERMIIALISIFWRAAVSSLPAFEYVLVPNYIQEGMRDALLKNAVPHFWRRQIVLKIAKIKPFLGCDLSLLVYPFIKRDTYHFDFIFVMAGHCVTVSLPRPRDYNERKDSALRAGSHFLRIAKVELNSIPQVSALLAQALAAAEETKTKTLA